MIRAGEQAGVVELKINVHQRTRTIASLLAATALGVALALFFQQRTQFTPGDETVARVEDNSVLPDTPETSMNNTELAGLYDPPGSSRSGSPMGETEASRLREVVTRQTPFPHDVMMDDYKRTLWAEITTNPPKLRRPGDPEVDADMAYRLYMLYGNCSIAPRTDRHVDENLQRITSHTERANAQMLERLESRANEFLDMYELCLLIPPDVDARLEAVNWMSEAVRLGHEIALVQFYEKAMGFILRPDRWTNTPPLVMLHPGLISEFKATARYALSQAIERGHPEAYLAMSRAYSEGVIYPKDDMMAYAYLRAAENRAAESRQILALLGRHKSELAIELDPDQLARAEQMAMDLQMEHRG